ncbi:carboxylating nicotinate-nucleotide diphosphorylase [Larsenimonas rhizosphaerae]|uniref:Probable nicotinate-nucleotide pyrophosphorylase [carboxylating] n=1 Tax=Larsenimonas rhizosphaerae TaxID=2944682 RepID=A0AA42CWN0_9GAMM|nr:carboxylating nicotinate-nucleotide diphosphorylase [Larsenimonas rhizosphaerae]MCX2522815.1 carboxylating nicotinate-nucleotide diphosphorylase [Larsenimonas rhizosphaerae]
MTFQDALAEDIRATASRMITEDIGGGDITAQLIPAAQWARAQVISREDAILCGVPWVEEIYRRLDPSVVLHWACTDGDSIAADTPFLTLEGPARALMTGERAALNLLQTLSGTATRTRHYVDLVADTSVSILDTRKTLPGLRLAQKYAVTCGGGNNHRIGLYDAFLIKENHISACGGIEAAIREARDIARDLPVQVEVETLEELDQALEAGADIIMLDNFSLDDMTLAVTRTAGRAQLEASGNVDDNTLLKIVATGVDRVSIGALTKHVQAIDLSMRVSDIIAR